MHFNVRCKNNMNTTPTAITLDVAFIVGISEPMTQFRFSRFPNIGDIVVGDEYVYTVVEIQHRNGLSVHYDPYVTVVLKHCGKVG